MSLRNEAGNESEILVSARPNKVNLPQVSISSGIFSARSLFPRARRTSRLKVVKEMVVKENEVFQGFYGGDFN